MNKSSVFDEVDGSLHPVLWVNNSTADLHLQPYEHVQLSLALLLYVVNKFNTHAHTCNLVE